MDKIIQPSLLASPNPTYHTQILSAQYLSEGKGSCLFAFRHRMSNYLFDQFHFAKNL